MGIALVGKLRESLFGAGHVLQENMAVTADHDRQGIGLRCFDVVLSWSVRQNTVHYGLGNRFKMGSTMGKQARLEARVSSDIHALLKRAAEIEGRSLSDFVVTAARQAAEKAVVQADIITLSYEDQLRFAQALIDPPPLAPAMERAIDRYKRMPGAA
ncbi:MAG: DUF1778 domain-containing protein [Thiohalocapsa sp.]